MPQLRLVVEESSEAARFNMEQEFSMRSSINMATQNLGPNRANSSFYFEELKHAVQEPYNTERLLESRGVSTFANFGCGT
mmetsp:Transcript_48362/g.35563  ORF Transcript_48362/g.35563 Transcript_48362/m.35563 type:complete len:80 (+) Transcript_48362:282-521(+)